MENFKHALKNLIQNCNERDLLIKLEELIRNKKFKKVACLVITFAMLNNVNNYENNSNVSAYNYEDFKSSIAYNDLIRDYNLSDRNFYDRDIVDNQARLVNGVTPNKIANPELFQEETEEIDASPEAVSNEEKLEVIYLKYNINYNQFKQIVCTVLAEADPDSYEDSYHVTSIIYNRAYNDKWTGSIRKVGDLIAQISSPNQFEGYKNKNYYKFFNMEDITIFPAYQAVIDCLYTEDVSNNYLSFKSNESNPNNKVQFVNGGNRYHNLQKSEDIIEDEDKLTNEEALELVRKK